MAQLNQKRARMKIQCCLIDLDGKTRVLSITHDRAVAAGDRA